jgi:hypothetical protein
MLNTLMFNMLVPTPFVFMQRSSRLLNRTRLVLFYVKNILAHHLFNCNVVWFVLGIIFLVDSCCKILFIHILDSAHHMLDKMSCSLFYLFKSI